jgi:hypothetical protein
MTEAEKARAKNIVDQMAAAGGSQAFFEDFSGNNGGAYAWLGNLGAALKDPAQTAAYQEFSKDILQSHLFKPMDVPGLGNIYQTDLLFEALKITHDVIYLNFAHTIAAGITLRVPAGEGIPVVIVEKVRDGARNNIWTIKADKEKKVSVCKLGMDAIKSVCEFALDLDIEVTGVASAASETGRTKFYLANLNLKVNKFELTNGNVLFNVAPGNNVFSLSDSGLDFLHPLQDGIGIEKDLNVFGVDLTSHLQVAIKDIKSNVAMSRSLGYKIGELYLNFDLVDNKDITLNKIHQAEFTLGAGLTNNKGTTWNASLNLTPTIIGNKPIIFDNGDKLPNNALFPIFPLATVLASRAADNAFYGIDPLSFTLGQGLISNETDKNYLDLEATGQHWAEIDGKTVFKGTLNKANLAIKPYATARDLNLESRHGPAQLKANAVDGSYFVKSYNIADYKFDINDQSYQMAILLDPLVLPSGEVKLDVNSWSMLDQQSGFRFELNREGGALFDEKGNDITKLLGGEEAVPSLHP